MAAKTKAKTPARGEIVKAAKELNEVLKPLDEKGEPAPMNVKLGVEKLTPLVLEAAALIEPDDELSQETIDTLLALDPKALPGLAGGEDEVVEEEKKEEKKPAKKAPAKKPAAKKTKPAPKKKEPAKPKVEKPVKQADSDYTRSHALVDALKKGGTRKEIVDYSNELFMKNGGKDNQNVANYMFGYVLPTLLILETVTKDGKNFSWNK